MLLMLPTERGQTPPPSFSACFCGFVSVGEFFVTFRGCDHSMTLIYIYSRDTFKILGSAFTFKIHLRFWRDWCWFARTVTATASASDIPEFRQYLRFDRFLTIYAYTHIDITRKSVKSKIWHISVESLKRSCYNFFGKLGAFRFSSLPTDKSLLFLFAMKRMRTTASLYTHRVYNKRVSFKKTARLGYMAVLIILGC